MPDVPVARSPIQPAPPTEVRAGWLVSVLPSHGPLRLSDRSPLAKVLVRASPRGRVAARLGVPFGRARRDQDNVLVIGSGPDEWLLLAPPDARQVVAGSIDTTDDEAVSVVDVTHGRALMRLSGADAHRVLAKLCAIDLSDAATPNGAAFRSSVAAVATDVIRDDQRNDTEPCYLLHCERSAGQYLFDALRDAGREFGLQVEGFLIDSAESEVLAGDDRR